MSGLPHATYYYHTKHQTQADKYEKIKAKITVIYHENKGRYGYCRITTELCRRGFRINHKTVQRLMKELGHICRVRMKKYKSYRGEAGKIAPDLLKWCFEAEKLSRKGNCLDNAVIENFFGLLKSELLYLQEFKSMEHFKAKLMDYMDYYNNHRSKAKLKGCHLRFTDSKPFRLLN